MTGPRLFANRLRTRLLILLALLEESYSSELARLLGVPLFSIQKIVDDFDRQGIIASRYAGRLRRLSLSPTFFAARELRALLLRLAEGDAETQEIAARRRSRPRRKGARL